MRSFFLCETDLSQCHKYLLSKARHKIGYKETFDFCKVMEIKNNLFSTFSVCFWIKNLSDRKDFPSPLGFLQRGCCDWILKDRKANLVLCWIFCLNGETKRLSNVLDDDCWQHRCWFFTVATGNWQLATGNTWCNFSDFVSRQTIQSLDSVISSKPLVTS